MMRINLVLLLAVVASALFLVSVQYDSRRLFTERDKADAEARRLEIEYERLQVEKRAQATPGRVERLAREKLQMHQVTPAITNYVNYTPPTTVASAPKPAASSAASATTGTPAATGAANAPAPTASARSAPAAMPTGANP